MNSFFWQMKIFFFLWGGGGSSQDWTIFRVVSIHFRVFSYSPIENQNDLELEFKVVSLLILVVQTLYLMNPTDATLASLIVWKY